MQLRSEKLLTHIQNKGLLPVYLISGDEPLQLNETTDIIRHQAKLQGIEERIILDVGVDFYWNRLADESANQSLFSNRRLLDLRLGKNKPGREGSKALSDYAQQLSSDDVLLISSSKLDKKNQQSKWYKSLDNVGATVQIWPIEADKLSSWIQYRFKRYNKSITQDIAQLIADSVEGNMLAASQEMEKLCLISNTDEISAHDVIAAVTDSSRFDVFSLIECAYAGQCKRLIRIFNGLKSEGQEPMAIYGVLMWDYRRLCMLAERYASGVMFNKLFAEYRIWNNKHQQAIQAIIRRYTVKQLYGFLQQANAIDKVIKSNDKHIVWDSLLLLLLSFAGYNNIIR